jgi:beta-lactamase regulating signal transducer with metallopeptidase domain
LYGLLALPALQAVAPPVRYSSLIFSNVEMTLLPERRSSGAGKDITVKAAPQSNVAGVSEPFPWMLAASAIYIAITLILLVRLLLSLFRLRQIVHRCEPARGPELQQLEHDVCLQGLSSTRPQIRVSGDVCAPMSIGIYRVSILLPLSWREWPSDKLRAVLIHEMAHVRRRDPATAFAASLAVCLFWLHPLSYALRRKLAMLAEEACDEAALRFLKPERYSQILIEFAEDMAARNRIPASGIAICRPQIEKRIERMFSFKSNARPVARGVRTLVAAAFVPALYLLAAAPVQRAGGTNGSSVEFIVSIANAGQAREIESDLRRHPENLTERGALMTFYANRRGNAAFMKHLLWVVDHRPDSPLAAMKSFVRDEEDVSGGRRRVEMAWEQALVHHHNSAEVLYHAGLYFEETNPQRALALFRQAKNMTLSDSEAQLRYLQSIALIYGAAVSADLNAGNTRFRIHGISMPLTTARELRTELEASNSPSLLSQVGTILVQIGANRQTQSGLVFLRKAIELDPGNLRWKEALESARVEPVRRQNRRTMIAALSRAQ